MVCLKRTGLNTGALSGASAQHQPQAPLPRQRVRTRPTKPPYGNVDCHMPAYAGGQEFVIRTRFLPLLIAAMTVCNSIGLSSFGLQPALPV